MGVTSANNTMSVECTYRVVYRGRVTPTEPRYWTAWPSIHGDFQTLAEARTIELQLQELRPDCEVKVQSKPIPTPWSDV